MVVREDRGFEKQEKGGRRWKNNFSKHLDIAILTFCVVAACILFYFALSRFDLIKKGIGIVISVCSPIIVGIIIAFLLNPIVMILEKKFLKIYQNHQASKIQKKKNKGGTGHANKVKKAKKKKESDEMYAKRAGGNEIFEDGRTGARRVAIFVTVVVVLVAIYLLVLAVIPAFSRSMVSLAERLPGYYTTISNYIIEFVNKREWLSKQIPNIDQMLKQFNLFDVLGDYINSLVSAAYNVVYVIFMIIYNFLIGLIIAIYLLGGKERYIAQMKKVVFAMMKPEKAKRFIKNMSNTNTIFKSAILGKILDSIIIGFLCFIGMSIFGMLGFEAIGDNRVLLSVVIGVTNVIQFFGPYIGGIPSVLLVFCENPVQGLIFGIFVIVLQQFDCNYLDPKIVGNSVGLSPLYVLIACIITGGLFGLPGMLVATPMGAVIYGFVKSSLENRLEDKNLPLETEAYVNEPK